MSSDLVLKGGTALTVRGVEQLDLVVSGDTVRPVTDESAPRGAAELDCTGCWVGPGLVDLHVHLREPGEEWKEDVASGSAAAAAGGFTAVVAMPNTDPPIDAGHLARFVSERAAQAGLVHVAVAGCITAGRRGERLAHLDDLLAAGVRIFTDDGDGVADAGLLRQAMEYLGNRGAIIAQHAEDRGLARDGHMHEGVVSSLLGMGGLPALAEEVVVMRDLGLVRITGTPYHVQHVSTAGTVELVRAAKAEGLPVTAEVTPHHLSFDEHAVESMDPAFKMYPPLRSKADVDAVREALLDGTIDAVATDHAPHAGHEKEVPFEHAPRGVIGLETALAAVLTDVGLDAEPLFDRMSVRPAAVAGLVRHGQPIDEGSPANLVVIDPEAPWVADRFVSKADNSPYSGRQLRGRVRATILEGSVTYHDGRVRR